MFFLYLRSNFLVIFKIISITFLMLLSFINISKTDNNNFKSFNKNKCLEILDPYEKFNRKIFKFNGVIDHIFLSPIARGYNEFFSNRTKEYVSNFVNNIEEPYSALNYTIQGRFEKSLLSIWRFMINSTLGKFGTEDIAQKANIKLKIQYIGNSLAYYGAAPGPYIVLPIFGGTSLRDMVDIILFKHLNYLKYSSSDDVNKMFFSIETIDHRAKLFNITDHISKYSLDPYASIRSMIMQKIESKNEYPKNFICPY